MSPEWNFQLPPNSRALKMGSGSWFWSAQKDGSQKKSESMSNFQIATNSTSQKTESKYESRMEF